MFDLATTNKKNVYIHGRVDDVINIRGHRIGSEEIESTVLQIKEIYECCAISVSDDIEGHVIFLFVVSEKSNIEKYYFDNDFGHSIEFYDGMMFEIYNPDNQSELISGGRYDKLLIDLGSKSNLSAVGFATNNNNIIELI